MRELLSQSSRRAVLPILLGAAIYAFGLHYFVLPNQLMEGGVTGIAVLLHYAADWPLSVSTLLLNIPLFAAGWPLLGWRQMILTLLGTAALTLSLAGVEQLIALGWVVPFRSRGDDMLAALYAGVTLGSGLGLVFRFGGTTGGADIVARIASRRRGWSMGRIILVLDGAIIGLALLYIPQEKVLYTLVAVFIASRIIDLLQDGGNSAKAFSIISAEADLIAETILRELERGVTLLPAIGAYSGTSRRLVYCVVARQDIRKMKAVVRMCDKTAFIVISEVHDVLGEGFTPPDDREADDERHWPPRTSAKRHKPAPTK
ncbi:YitT family protein [Paenibacillus sp. IB182496]|uniref:YitT family protein n=1 Tax=Paenibacillus sabuli TaxID=2772509 RepID=A0A927BRU5_9BACL|nr:YitT family protein [Paenibacillus sabuli]MBD2845137.1 YitT family protein [Paenibacillus sabuli]